LTEPVRPKVWDDLVLASVNGEMVVYNPREADIHHLNSQAALALQLFDGTGTLKEIAEDIAATFELDEREVRGQIRAVHRQFKDQGLLEGSERYWKIPESYETQTPTAGIEPDDADWDDDEDDEPG
jgi:PqqD family protein of HPr-rel-A system